MTKSHKDKPSAAKPPKIKKPDKAPKEDFRQLIDRRLQKHDGLMKKLA